MTSPIIAFSVSPEEHRLLDAAAAEHALSASQWTKAAALELARTVNENRAAAAARRTTRKTTTP